MFFGDQLADLKPVMIGINSEMKAAVNTVKLRAVVMESYKMV